MEISIIVPIYNVEKYLRRGLDSLIRQSNFEKLEIILINDGSIDSSKKICEEYAEKYSNINLYNQKNGGVSSARNSGLKKVTSKYVCFFDPDDEVEPEFYQYLYNQITKEKCDIVSTDFKIKFMDSSLRKKRQNYVKRISGNFDILKTFLRGGIIVNNLFDKIFKAEIAKSIEFPEGKKVGEDMYYVYKYLEKCQSLVVDTNCSGYIYYQNECSAMNSKFSIKFLDAVELSEKLRDEAQNQERLYDFLYSHEIHERVKLMEYMIKNNGIEEYNDIWKENEKIISKCKIKILYKCLTKKQFLGYMLMRTSPKLYIKIFEIMKIG